MVTRRAVLYARISVANEDSVSIARQLDAGRAHAAANGWEVAGEYVDEGVSASTTRPDRRPGWQALLTTPDPYDLVIVWKVDRLARNVLDFLTADQALREQRDAALVAVADSIDMSTPTGRAFATMLSIFGEMEAASISARVAAARRHLLQTGRAPGGSPPYGWQTVPNPTGPGFVLAQDPERAVWVQQAAERVLAGESVYGVTQWLTEAGAPLPRAAQANRKRHAWRYATVERTLRHPLLAGMVPYNPGNKTRSRGDGVLRDADGLPVVNADLAVMPLDDWQRMVRQLDNRTSPQARPRAARATTSGLLSGLLWCDHHDDAVRMHRGTVQGRPGYYCPQCHQAVSAFEDTLVAHLLEEAPDRDFKRLVIVAATDPTELARVEHRLAEVSTQLRATDDDAEEDRLLGLLRDLKRRRTTLRTTRPTERLEEVGGETVAADYSAATTDRERRAALDTAVDRVLVRRGKPGRRTTAQLLARFTVVWRWDTPSPPPTDAQLAEWADDDRASE